MEIGLWWSRYCVEPVRGANLGDIIMSERSEPATLQRSRRNLAKAAAVTLAAMLGASARSKRAFADDGEEGGGGGTRCFLRGTKIRTVTGYRCIEDLSAGDLVPTLFGRTRPIRAVRRLQFERPGPNQPWREEHRPIRVRRSALDDGIPHADLYLTGAHALYLEGVLVPVRHLINGVTIERADVEAQPILEYFHIELDGHDVVDAQGASCETLREAGVSACAPLLSLDGGRSELRSRLRSAVSPWIDRRGKLEVVRDDLDERADRIGLQQAASENGADQT
jgi:Hint domain